MLSAQKRIREEWQQHEMESEQKRLKVLNSVLSHKVKLLQQQTLQETKEAEAKRKRGEVEEFSSVLAKLEILRRLRAKRLQSQGNYFLYHLKRI